MKQLLTILGPTASGKTTLATRLAYELDGEVISADSRQVYRGMTIGTGKDLADYVVEEKPIPYHLIDICDPGTKYNLFEYQRDFLQAYEDIRRRGCQPVLCGGTGLYIEAVLRGYQLSPVPQNPTLRGATGGEDARRADRHPPGPEDPQPLHDAQPHGCGLLSAGHPRDRDRGVQPPYAHREPPGATHPLHHHRHIGR